MEEHTAKGSNKKKQLPLSPSDKANIAVAVTSIIACAASIVAIWIAVLQFDKSIERADRQFRIGIEREEKRDRPILAVSENEFKYLNNPFRFQVATKILNYGSRPAYKCQISCFTFFQNKEKQTASLVDIFNDTLSNPFVPEQVKDFNMTSDTGIKPTESGKYLFLIIFGYDDNISNLRYFDRLYYTWEYTISNSDLKLYEAVTTDARLLDSLYQAYKIGGE